MSTGGKAKTTQPMRSFTIENSEVKLSGDSSRFINKAPGAAAAKAARRCFKESKNPNKHEIKFSIRETTQDSAKKVWKYIGIKETLDEPLVLTRNGKTSTITHKYVAKSCNTN